jgi:hypothetical protein
MTQTRALATATCYSTTPPGPDHVQPIMTTSDGTRPQAALFILALPTLVWRATRNSGTRNSEEEPETV